MSVNQKKLDLMTFFFLFFFFFFFFFFFSESSEFIIVQMSSCTSSILVRPSVLFRPSRLHTTIMSFQLSLSKYSLLKSVATVALPEHSTVSPLC
eukprot:SAG31_NODE_2433_length_5706_cov_2.207776_1_plen_94_part_00